MLAPSSTRQNIFPGGILHCQKSRGFQENSCRFSASLGQPKGAPTAPLRHPDLSLGRRPSRLGRLVVSSAWESHLPCRSRQRLARSAVWKNDDFTVWICMVHIATRVAVERATSTVIYPLLSGKSIMVHESEIRNY